VGRASVRRSGEREMEGGGVKRTHHFKRDMDWMTNTKKPMLNGNGITDKSTQNMSREIEFMSERIRLKVSPSNRGNENSLVSTKGYGS